MATAETSNQWTCFGVNRPPPESKTASKSTKGNAIGIDESRPLNRKVKAPIGRKDTGSGEVDKILSTSNSESGQVKIESRKVPQSQGALKLKMKESQEVAEDSEVGDSREKAISILRILTSIGFKFDTDAINQIRAKLDLDTPEDLKVKVILKILKTKLRKTKRKERNRESDNCRPKDSGMHASKKTSSAGFFGVGEYSSSDSEEALESISAHEAEEILHTLISVQKEKKSSEKPGARLLEFLRPKPIGIYWLNNSKLPEIKALWRRRLLRAIEVQRPDDWPAVVPANYRLNICKKPVGYRGRQSQEYAANSCVSHQKSPLLLDDSVQPSC